MNRYKSIFLSQKNILRKLNYQLSTTTNKIIPNQQGIKQIMFQNDFFYIKNNLEYLKKIKSFEQYEITLNLSDNMQQNDKMAQIILTSNNLYAISYTLQLLYNATKLGQNHIISAQTYKQILKKYYYLFGISKDAAETHHLKRISEKVNLKSLLPNFIYQQNSQILQILKLNQKYLLQKLIESRDVTLDEFMKIINTSIYNITDLPLLHHIFYRHFIPKVHDVLQIKKCQDIMEYLYYFQRVQQSSLDVILKLINQQLSKPILQMESFQVILDLLSFSFYKRSVLTAKKDKVPQKIENFLKNLYEKSIVIQGRAIKIKQLLNSSEIYKEILQSYQQSSSIVSQQAIKQKQEMLKICQQKDNETSLIYILCMRKQQDLINLSSQQIKKCLYKLRQNKMTQALIKWSGLMAYSKLINVQTYINFLTNEHNHLFITQNAYLPDFLKDIVKIHERIRHDNSQILMKEGLKQKCDKIEIQFTKFRNRITAFIEEQIVQLSDQLKSQHELGQISYFKYFHPLEINILSTSNMNQLLFYIITEKNQQQNEQYKIVQMLRKDPLYLSTNIYFNGHQILDEFIKNNLSYPNAVTNKWHYPYFYNYIHHNQHYNFINHFNKNEIEPLNRVGDTLNSNKITNYHTFSKTIKVHKAKQG